ncbi:DUF2971 domain-containing protein [Mucilaginibacter sp. ZT4R22]|uniref:DUF2971 domain-containing protein n=1 Tax=Mucilaginibacter pankratovii TaxID=2772110 RepID=A0ABR7WS44_9SPHI|nr:DUF2971 domain-containing protein [Mucilaginibacter pankratovii]MBD1365128.1 DUF2971 domain-containing protein [Mucilaginibacter pankratovii]
MEKLVSEDLKVISRQNLQSALNQKLLYKYASFSTAAKYIIEEKTLKFTNPLDFNDPFDCNEEILNINIDPARLDEYAKNTGREFNRRQRRELVRTAKKKYSYAEVLKLEKKKFKICCFSTKNADTLMWSHYGDMHRGICCGFELPLMSDQYNIYPVNYISKIEKLDGLIPTDQMFHYWLTRKSICWEYESEIRAIGRDLPDKVSFESEQLKEIVFGCKVKDKDIEKQIKAVKKARHKWIRFKKMQIDKSTFALKSVDL